MGHAALTWFGSRPGVDTSILLSWLPGVEKVSPALFSAGDPPRIRWLVGGVPVVFQDHLEEPSGALRLSEVGHVFGLRCFALPACQSASTAASAWAWPLRGSRVPTMSNSQTNAPSYLL